MAEHATTAVAEVPAHGNDSAHGEVNLFKPDALIMGLTWLTFLLTTVVLYKVAWKPILAALDKREADIRQSLEDAQKHRDALAQLDERRQQVIAEADAKAKELVTQARQAALEASATIQNKARDEAQILLANASARSRRPTRRLWPNCAAKARIWPSGCPARSSAKAWMKRKAATSWTG